MDTERICIYRLGYMKWYTLQMCLSNTQSFHKFENEEENRVIENKDGDTISEDTEIAKKKDRIL